MRDRHVEKCRFAMLGGGWWTLTELAEIIGCSEAAASARVRDLRKPAYGGHRVLCRHTGPGGLHKYCMALPAAGIASHEHPQPSGKGMQSLFGDPS